MQWLASLNLSSTNRLSRSDGWDSSVTTVSWGLANGLLGPSVRSEGEYVVEEILIDCGNVVPSQEGGNKTKSDQVQNTVENSLTVRLDLVSTLTQAPGNGVQEPNNDLEEDNSGREGDRNKTGPGTSENSHQDQQDGKKLSSDCESEETPFVSRLDQSTNKQAQDENGNSQGLGNQVSHNQENVSHTVTSEESSGAIGGSISGSSQGIGGNGDGKQVEGPSQEPADILDVEHLPVI